MKGYYEKFSKLATQTKKYGVYASLEEMINVELIQKEISKIQTIQEKKEWVNIFRKRVKECTGYSIVYRICFIVAELIERDIVLTTAFGSNYKNSKYYQAYEKSRQGV